jgi:hypothetical protein
MRERSALRCGGGMVEGLHAEQSPLQLPWQMKEG